MAGVKNTPYLDMPLQHGSESILRSMRRPLQQRKYWNGLPDGERSARELTLRSTFIVSFPGERDRLRAVARFLRAEIWTGPAVLLLPIDGAANSLPDQVAENGQAGAVGAIYVTTGRDKPPASCSKKVGRDILVMVDAVEENRVIARSAADARK